MAQCRKGSICSSGSKWMTSWFGEDLCTISISSSGAKSCLISTNADDSTHFWHSEQGHCIAYDAGTAWWKHLMHVTWLQGFRTKHTWWEHAAWQTSHFNKVMMLFFWSWRSHFVNIYTGWNKLHHHSFWYFGLQRCSNSNDTASTPISISAEVIVLLSWKHVLSEPKKWFW